MIHQTPGKVPPRNYDCFQFDNFSLISTRELGHIMTNLGDTLRQAEIEEMLRHADLNSDGQINYQEWISLMMSTSD